MSKLTIDVIAGARPNFMKIAALFAVDSNFPDLKLRFIHTGQHYDPEMSDVFLKELNLPVPTRCLGVGSASHAVQTAEIMRQYDAWINTTRPDLCLVVGDVNSTISCALVAVKVGIKIAHVEAGLRSFDRTMPEEINRVLTDSISNWHFVSEPSGVINLQKEGHDGRSIHLVGNVMIDTLFRMKAKAEKLQAYRQFQLQPRRYAYLTLHRPANVDSPEMLKEILEQILWVTETTPVVFPVHPRTRKRLGETGLGETLRKTAGLHLTEPLGYLDSLSVMMNAKLVMTDSGGMQEETTALGVPCLTLRDSTERPITIEKGTNVLIGRDWQLLRRTVQNLQNRENPLQESPIPYWDGQTGQRILNILQESVEK